MTDKLKEAREYVQEHGLIGGNHTDFTVNEGEEFDPIYQTIRHMLTPLTDDEVEEMMMPIGSIMQTRDMNRAAATHNHTLRELSKDYYLIPKGEK